MLHKEETLWYYDLFPKVVPVGRPVEITIRALAAHKAFKSEHTEQTLLQKISAHAEHIQVRIVPINAHPDSKGESCKCTATAREIHFTYTFSSEQEYQIRIFSSKNVKPLAKLAVYAVENDLLALKPLIGDFHAHSCGSDGLESPEFVASRYREEGFDFFTLTDHRRYAPSVTAQNAYQDLDMDFKIYRGEEIHTQSNPVHIINFGADEPINVEYLTEASTKSKNCWTPVFRPDWLMRVKQIQKSLDPLPDGVDPFIHASFLLIAKLIREKGGMCIFAHPHWKCSVRNVPDAWSRYWLKTGIADAFELIGGQSVRENTTQIALYQELRAEGYQIPIVASSDSHGTCSNVNWGDKPDTYHMFTEERTMVFAKENTKKDIIEAVKSLHSVALEQYEGEPCRVHGPYRLVQYALFLVHEYFPLQEDLCREEGRLMRAYANAEEEAKQRLQKIGHQTTALREKYFAKI